MGKLFDLMIMGFKLQLMSVSPRDRGRGWSQGREHIFGSATEEEGFQKKFRVIQRVKLAVRVRRLEPCKNEQPKAAGTTDTTTQNDTMIQSNHSSGNLQVYVISDPVLYALNLQSHSAGDH